jgi:hypothetical protein
MPDRLEGCGPALAAPYFGSFPLIRFMVAPAPYVIESLARKREVGRLLRSWNNRNSFR